MGHGSDVVVQVFTLLLEKGSPAPAGIFFARLTRVGTGCTVRPTAGLVTR